jgi:hypothetical protein
MEETSFTNAGEFQNVKGVTVARFGARQKVDARGRTLDADNKTPNTRASEKLLIRLRDGRGMPEETARGYIDTMLKLDRLRFLNLDVLSWVLKYVHESDFDLNNENVRFDVVSGEDYVNGAMQDQHSAWRRDADLRRDDVSEINEKVTYIRMVCTFIRYIEYAKKAKTDIDEDLYDEDEDLDDDQYIKKMLGE